MFFTLLKNSLLVANRKERNSKDVSLRNDPCNINTDFQVDGEYGYNSCQKKNKTVDNFLDKARRFTTDRSSKIGKDSVCIIKKCCFYGYCLANCQKQGKTSDYLLCGTSCFKLKTIYQI